MTTTKPPRGTGPPSQTLYVQNLPSRRPPSKLDLRRALYLLFSTYGPVLDVVAVRTAKMRGQAHVVYRDVQSAAAAVRALQARDFMGQELRLSYAATPSNILAKLAGSYAPPKTLALTAAATTTATGAPAGATALQQSVFGAKAPGAPNLAPPPAAGVGAGPTSPQGVKRRRDDEDEDEDGDGDAGGEREDGGEAEDGEGAPMEEESDEDAEMDVSDED